jgi:hypothetical protein
VWKLLSSVTFALFEARDTFARDTFIGIKQWLVLTRELEPEVVAADAPLRVVKPAVASERKSQLFEEVALPRDAVSKLSMMHPRIGVRERRTIHDQKCVVETIRRVDHLLRKMEKDVVTIKPAARAGKGQKVKGKGKAQEKEKPMTAEELNASMDDYWMKSKDKTVASKKLDEDMDDYWAKKGEENAEDAAAAGDDAEEDAQA